MITVIFDFTPITLVSGSTSTDSEVSDPLNLEIDMTLLTSHCEGKKNECNTFGSISVVSKINDDSHIKTNIQSYSKQDQPINIETKLFYINTNLAQCNVKSDNYLPYTFIMGETYIISKPESNVPKTYKQVLQSSESIKIVLAISATCNFIIHQIELILKLLYVSITVRGVIAYITNKLIRHFQQSNELHLRYANHVLRYLILTKHLDLLYKKRKNHFERAQTL